MLSDEEIERAVQQGRKRLDRSPVDRLELATGDRLWFADRPPPARRTIVIGVDPAETGTGDEAGIIVAGAAEDGQLYVMADLSGLLTQAQWARLRSVRRHPALPCWRTPLPTGTVDSAGTHER